MTQPLSHHQCSLRAGATTAAGALAPALLAAAFLAGCVVVDKRPEKPGPPPWAPAYGARAKKVPPPVTVTPTVVVIAGSPVAYAANWPEDLFYYEGRWYRPYEGNWYWSVTVGGTWTQISVSQVPKVVLEVPPDYRQRSRGGPPPWAPAHGAREKGKP